MLARNLPGICLELPEFARNSEFARNLLGIRSENGPGPAMRGTLHSGSEPASQCARVCRNYPLANYPVVSPR